MTKEERLINYKLYYLSKLRDNTDSLRDVKYFHLAKGCKKLHTRKGKHLRAVLAELSMMRKKAGGGAGFWRVRDYCTAFH